MEQDFSWLAEVEKENEPRHRDQDRRGDGKNREEETEQQERSKRSKIFLPRCSFRTYTVLRGLRAWFFPYVQLCPLEFEQIRQLSTYLNI